MPQVQLVLRGLCALHLLRLPLLLLSGAHFSGLTEIVPLIHKYVSYSLFRKGGVLSFLEAGRKNSYEHQQQQRDGIGMQYEQQIL